METRNGQLATRRPLPTLLDTTLTVDVDHTCDFVVRPNKLLSGPRLKGWHNQLNGESAINNEVHRRAEKIRGSIS